MVQRVDIASQ